MNVGKVPISVIYFYPSVTHGLYINNTTTIGEARITTTILFNLDYANTDQVKRRVLTEDNAINSPNNVIHTENSYV